MESKKEILSERIKIRLTKEQRNRLVSRAAKASTTLSGYMRSRLSIKDKIISSTHQESVLELRKIGAELKSIFDSLQQNGMSPELNRKHAEVFSRLIDILEHIASDERWRRSGKSL